MCARASRRRPAPRWPPSDAFRQSDRCVGQGADLERFERIWLSARTMLVRVWVISAVTSPQGAMLSGERAYEARAYGREQKHGQVLRDEPLHSLRRPRASRVPEWASPVAVVFDQFSTRSSCQPPAPPLARLRLARYSRATLVFLLSVTLCSSRSSSVRARAYVLVYPACSRSRPVFRCSARFCSEALVTSHYTLTDLPPSCASP